MGSRASVLEGFSSKQNEIFVDAESQFPRKALPKGRGMWEREHSVC